MTSIMSHRLLSDRAFFAVAVGVAIAITTLSATGSRACGYHSPQAIARGMLNWAFPKAHQLKTPYRDGTTHVISEPLDFIARMAALAPKPQTNLSRVHTVIAPDSKCSEPVGWAPAECPLRSSVDVSQVRVILAVLCCLESTG
jgi:hypothetical protein